MKFSKESIEQLVAGKFSQDFIEVTLTQQDDTNTEIFTGSGFLYYKNNKPHLKILHKEDDPLHRLYPTYSNLDNGEVIAEKYLFSLLATDLNGNTWHAKDIDPYKNMSASSSGISIDCEIYNIYKELDSDFQEFSYIFIVPQKCHIPCNLFQDLGEGGKRRTRCSFILDHIEVSVLLEDNYSSIHIKSNEPIEFDQADSIVNALSVAGCTQLTPVAVRTQTPASNSILLKGINIKLSTPLMDFLPQRSPNYLNEWIEFIKSYFGKFGTDKTFYYYWLKVFNSHQSDLENETLSLTVSIEGIVNKFHSKFKQCDTDFINLCREVMPTIDKLQINDRVKSSILTLLETRGQASPKGTLFNMAEQGVFPKELATAWSKARNKSAHAEHFKKNAWQDNIKNYTYCMSLFYILLSYHIEYKGYFYHHHLHNAPLQKLNFISNTSKQGVSGEFADL
ncbi:hypothetical protein ACX3SZ_00465 [Escherichia coli]|uniref:hypothetical protein n=1 Tax=Escherichia coli TaxID=562 RepID=UPI000E1DDC91|nr:hypothetical protein [Escherichia coli]RDS12872.1 hypothetical protein C3992_03710 [Escherichia coli]HAH8754643.1 hypothetical protein [Escherichia coli]